MSSESLSHVVWYKLSNFSEVLTASTIKAIALSMKQVRRCNLRRQKQISMHSAHCLLFLMQRLINSTVHFLSRTIIDYILRYSSSLCNIRLMYV